MRKRLRESFHPLPSSSCPDAIRVEEDLLLLITDQHSHLVACLEGGQRTRYYRTTFVDYARPRVGTSVFTKRKLSLAQYMAHRVEVAHPFCSCPA